MTLAARLRATMLDWAKAIHEAIGTESPRIFIAVFAIAGLLLFGFTGWIIDRGYRVKLREQPSIAGRTPSNDAQREFTQRTPHELLAFYVGHTALQADKLIEPYKGLWIRAEGTVTFLGPDGSGFVTVLRSGPDTIECRLGNKWGPELGRLNNGDKLKVRGKISPNQNGSQLYLLEVEIDSDPPATSPPVADMPPANPGPPIKLASNEKTTSASAPDGLELLSDDVGVRIRFYRDPSPGGEGLLIRVINETTEPLKSCTVRVNGARSFDSKRKTFVPDQLAHVLLPPFGNVAHNGESDEKWLVRISSDQTHLELGSINGQGILRWPTREPIARPQVWLLDVSVEADGLAACNFCFRMEWGQNTIKVRNL